MTLNESFANTLSFREMT